MDLRCYICKNTFDDLNKLCIFKLYLFFDINKYISLQSADFGDTEIGNMSSPAIKHKLDKCKIKMFSRDVNVCPFFSLY